jgi:bifunctional DNase/RNase
VPEDLVEVELSRVVIHEKGDQQFIHLRERSGERSFPIVIGFNEAAEINRKLRSLAAPRPMTHDLIGRILETLDWKLLRVAVTELRDSTFYAVLELDHDGERRYVDCRPSDAIALAVQMRSPVFVSKKVLDVVAPA